MTVALMIYGLLVGALLGAAALVFERAASWLRLEQRWIWLATMVALPVLTFSAPRRAIPPAPPTIVSGGDSIAVGRDGIWRRESIEPIFRAVAKPARGPSADEVDTVATWVWVAMSGLALAHYAGGRLVLARRRRRWAQIDLRGHPVLVAPDAGPAIIGCWFTTIVVPRWALRLGGLHIDLLLAHERQHESARDPVLIHLSQLAVIVMPWNPATWWMTRRLRSAVEMDCDSRVLAERESPADLATYGELLITVAARANRRASRLSPALIERPSVLRRRIAAMHATQPRAVRTKCAVAAFVTCGLIGAAFTFPVPSLEAHWTPPTAPMPSVPVPSVAAPAITQGSDGGRVNLGMPSGVKPIDTTDAKREPEAIEMPDLEGAPPAIPAPQTPAATATAPGIQGTDHVAAASNGQVSVAGASRRPVVVREVKPIYTKEALHEEIQGVVQLEAVVDENGVVRDVRVTHSLDTIYGLDQEAIRAARGWRFQPARDRDDKPVPIIVTLEIEFRLPASADGFGAGAVHIGPGLQAPVAIRDVKPVYTSDAMREKIQGVVQLEVVIDEDGTVRDLRVIRSLDKVYGLDQEAMKAARLWLFRPALDQNKKPVAVITTLELEFRLH